MKGIKYYLPGIILILSGVLIVVFPEILIALLAFIVIMAGMGALYIGKILNEPEHDIKNRFRDGFDDGFFENNWRLRKPFFRYYRRWF